jgi:hypothetical protein
MARLAPTIVKNAALSTEFGYNYAVELFGQTAIDSIPVLKAGPNKGKPKGYVFWMKTTAPGYHHYAAGGVGANVTIRCWIGETFGTPENDAALGFWHGRWQNLCGVRSILGEKAQAMWVRDRLRGTAERYEKTQEALAELPDDEARYAYLTRSAEWSEDLEKDRQFGKDAYRRAFHEKMRAYNKFGPNFWTC